MGRKSSSRSPSPAAVASVGGRRTVAIVGSTGGGAANAQALGSANAHANLTLLIAQLDQASIDVVAVVFTSCDSPMDTASPDSAAALWRLTDADPGDGTRRLVKTAEGELEDVNSAVRAADKALSRRMPDGVVMISGDVDDCNRLACESAPPFPAVLPCRIDRVLSG